MNSLGDARVVGRMSYPFLGASGRSGSPLLADFVAEVGCNGFGYWPFVESCALKRRL
jgi:hypothetical protein